MMHVCELDKAILSHGVVVLTSDFWQFAIDFLRLVFHLKCAQVQWTCNFIDDALYWFRFFRISPAGVHEAGEIFYFDLDIAFHPCLSFQQFPYLTPTSITDDDAFGAELALERQQGL